MQREQSWISRHKWLHRLFNAAIVLVLAWAVFTAVLVVIHVA